MAAGHRMLGIPFVIAGRHLVHSFALASARFHSLATRTKSACAWGAPFRLAFGLLASPRFSPLSGRVKVGVPFTATFGQASGFHDKAQILVIRRRRYWEFIITLPARSQRCGAISARASRKCADILISATRRSGGLRSGCNPSNRARGGVLRGTASWRRT